MLPPEKSTPPKKSVASEHSHFLALLILVAGFSLYAIASFFNSTSDYIDGMYANVTDGDVTAPPECSTCPPFSICDSVCGDSSVQPYEIFTDVYSDHKYAKEIESLYYEGLIGGYDDGSFKPNNTVNRAELLTIVTNAVDANLAGAAYSNCFTDVKTEWFAPFVCYAKVAGWVNGYQDGGYRPANTVIRAEALKIVMMAYGFDVPSFVTYVPYTDVAVSDWYAPVAATAYEYGVFTGSAGAFHFDHQMTRAEFVSMVYNAKNAELDSDRFGGDDEDIDDEDLDDGEDVVVPATDAAAGTELADCYGVCFSNEAYCTEGGGTPNYGTRCDILDLPVCCVTDANVGAVDIPDVCEGECMASFDECTAAGGSINFDVADCTIRQGCEAYCLFD